MIYLIFMFTFIRTQRWWRWKKKYFPSPSLLSQKFIVCSSFSSIFPHRSSPHSSTSSTIQRIQVSDFAWLRKQRIFKCWWKNIFIHSFYSLPPHFIVLVLVLAFSLGCRLVFFMLSSLLSCLMLNEFKNGNVFVLTSALAHTKDERDEILRMRATR